MKHLQLIAVALVLTLTGCESIKEHATEPNARKAAEWVRERSGFIENAVQAITHVAVYSAEKDTAERERILAIMNAVSGNLNALMVNGQVDPESIKNALRIDEPYFGPLFASIALLIHSETQNFTENGYADLTVSILAAVSKGIRNGTVQ